MNQKKKRLHRLLLHWYKKNKRSLPWRLTHNPYRILLSEIMLQQTQVARVEQIYPRFLQTFPSLKNLAQSAPSKAIRAWRGMGYNRRALRLRDLALKVVSELNGKLPQSTEELQSLPGIGGYTAHAVSCFAFGQQVPVVDVNVRRVLSRIFWRMKKVSEARTDSEIWKFAATLLPRGRAYDWNQALMEFGATICTKLKPNCSACPINTTCASAASLSSSRPPVRTRIKRT